MWFSNDLRQRVQGVFYDREKRELRPIPWGLVGLIMAIRLGYPAVHESRAYRWLSRPILLPLVLATFALGGLVVYVHYVR